MINILQTEIWIKMMWYVHHRLESTENTASEIELYISVECKCGGC